MGVCTTFDLLLAKVEELKAIEHPKCKWLGA